MEVTAGRQLMPQPDETEDHQEQSDGDGAELPRELVILEGGVESCVEERLVADRCMSRGSSIAPVATRSAKTAPVVRSAPMRARAMRSPRRVERTSRFTIEPAWLAA